MKLTHNPERRRAQLAAKGLIVLLLLFAAGAGAQELPPVATTVVPVVGSTFGVSMARWLSHRGARVRR